MQRIRAALEPGVYEIAIVLPAKAYRVEGIPGFKQTDLKATGSFTVTAGDRAAAHKAIRPGDIQITRHKGSFPEVIPTGTLKNGFTKPILIRVRPAADGTAKSALKPPLRPRMVWQRWHPIYGWVFPVYELPPEHEHWPVRRLAPGESVDIVLPEWDLEGDGVYRFGIAVYDATRPGTPFLTHVGTDAFVVDRVRPPARLPEKK